MAPVPEGKLALLMVGPPPLTVKLAPPEVPPPGPGLKTVTTGLPAAAMSAAGMLACRPTTREPPPDNTRVVVRSEPFHRTMDPEPNVEPFTVSVNAAPPAGALDDESEVMTGSGAFTEKLAWVVDIPLGLVTCAVQVAGSLLRTTLTCIWLELLNVVLAWEIV